MKLHLTEEVDNWLHLFTGTGSKQGIINNQGNAMYRHSMLKLGHLDMIDDQDMPPEEREWLKRDGSATSLSTVLKAGEVLYIPSFWFDYINSLQKIVPCNVRSGVDRDNAMQILEERTMLRSSAT
jgi:hypothetical protein